jgi:hypothetical protein
LVEHELDVLMARPAQRHDEEPCLERLPGLMDERRDGTEVDLRGIGRREIRDRCGGDAALGASDSSGTDAPRNNFPLAVVACKRTI